MNNKNVIINFASLSLTTDLENDKYATLSWSIRNGYPRASVYFNNSRKERLAFSYDNLITSPFTQVMIYTVIDKIKDVIKAEKGTKTSVKCFNTKYSNNGPTDEIYLQSTFVIGKDKDGCVYLAAVAEGKPKIKFILQTNSKWFKVNDNDNNEITDQAELSVMAAKAYVARLEAGMNKHLDDVPKRLPSNIPSNFNSDDVI